MYQNMFQPMIDNMNVDVCIFYTFMVSTILDDLCSLIIIYDFLLFLYYLKSRIMTKYMYVVPNTLVVLFYFW